jgi:hypothetical protein
MCTRACTTTQQCGAGLICSGPLFANVSGDFCADPCTNNSQCPVGRGCQLRDNRTGDAFDPVCAEPIGTLATGAASVDGLQCQSGLVVSGQCSELCNAAANTCPSLMPTCVALDIQTPAGGIQSVTACVGP